MSNIRTEYVWMIVTIGARRNSYTLRAKTPKSLKQNEYAYRIKIENDLEAWKERMYEVKMAKVDPPEHPALTAMESKAAKCTAGQVIDRMAGR